MPLAMSLSVALVGLDGHLVEVEADLAGGLPGLSITGLPDAALNEARDRVRAAVVNSGFAWPDKKITLGLGPASLPKKGSGFDLALAAALLAAHGQLPPSALTGLLLIGELGLDGRIKQVPGVLPALLAAEARGVVRVVVPAGNLAEARLASGVESYGLATLLDLVSFLRDGLYDDPRLRPSMPTRWTRTRATSSTSQGNPSAAWRVRWRPRAATTCS